MLKYISQSYPFPAVRYLERYLVRDADRLIFADLLIRQVIGTTEDDGRVLFFLNFALFDELFFLCTDAFQQNRSRFIARVLWDKFTLDSVLENGLLELIRKDSV